MVATAWRSGLVDARTVAVIVEQVGCLDLDTAQEVAAAPPTARVPTSTTPCE